jgi:hypothetical protein
MTLVYQQSSKVHAKSMIRTHSHIPSVQESKRESKREREQESKRERARELLDMNDL